MPQFTRLALSVSPRALERKTYVRYTHTLHWLHLGACGCRGKRAPIPAWNVKRSIIIAAAWFAGVAEKSAKPVTENFRVHEQRVEPPNQHRYNCRPETRQYLRFLLNIKTYSLVLVSLPSFSLDIEQSTAPFFLAILTLT